MGLASLGRRGGDFGDGYGEEKKMSSEKTSEGIEDTGLPPNPANLYSRLKDTDPQLYEIVVCEITRVLGLPEHEIKTLEDIAAALDKERRVALDSVTTLRSYLDTVIQTAIGDADDKSLSFQARVVNTVNRIKQLQKTQAELAEEIRADGTPPQTKPASKDLPVFVSSLLENSPLDAPSAWDILRTCLELAVFLIDKNCKYGDSALDPMRIMSSADPLEQIKVRIDDKLSRLFRGQAGGEDALQDLVGYWVLMRVAKRRQR